MNSVSTGVTTDSGRRPGVSMLAAGAACVLLGTLLGPERGYAETVIDASVTHRDGRFAIHSEVLIDVPVERTRTILGDYDALPWMNDGIKSVEILTPVSTTHARMRILSEVCILLICIDYSWVQVLYTAPSGDIVAVIDPAGSDFREGRARWQLLPRGAQTLLILDAELVPNFWFPPLIGPWFIKDKLRSETRETALGIERIASGD